MRTFVLLITLSSSVLAFEPIEQRQKELRNLLKHDCGACHGLTLKGGLGSSLLPSALAEKSDEFLIMTILMGRPGTAMPPWKGIINRNEAAWLVDLLKKPQP